MRYSISSPQVRIEYSSYDAATNENKCHGEYEISCILRGAGKCIIEGSEFPVGPLSLLIFRPMTYHTLKIEDSLPYEHYTVTFSKEALGQDTYSMLENLLRNSDSGTYFPAGTVTDRVISTLVRFEVARELPPEEKNAYVRALLAELIVFIFAMQGEKIQYSDEELGPRVLRYLNENITADLSLDKLSQRFFVSKYYLCRAFKKQNGVSIHSYVSHKRIMYAKGLIDAGETASGAAYKVGFGDYSAFYRAYVKLVGQSPTKENRKEKV